MLIDLYDRAAAYFSTGYSICYRCREVNRLSQKFSMATAEMFFIILLWDLSTSKGPSRHIRAQTIVTAVRETLHYILGRN